jgi:two-component system, NtrC family, sensor kinase
MAANGNGEEAEKKRKTYYKRLFRRFVLMTMICSIVPLLMVGWAINIHYTRFAERRAVESFKMQLEHHRTIIELFLKERTTKLYVVAKTFTRDQLTAPLKLNEVFDILNRKDGSFTDLGVICEEGSHLAYVGPFDLMDKNYFDQFWFKEVMQSKIFISDMFMGFRKVPHYIIAVVREENGMRWILRATVDTEVFRSLVESTRVGKTGEVFLVNREGVFQTSPRFSGHIMEKAHIPVDQQHPDIQIDIVENALDSTQRKLPKQIVARTWLSDPQWMLVVRQDYAEALDAVNHANFSSLVGLHLSALIILAVTVLITRHMITVIKRRDLEADQLNKQYMQASKLAAIGELSSGVAHEINNPLAIILTERQIMMDMANQAPNAMEPEFKGQFLNSMGQISVQIERCKRITHNLLRFARRTHSMIETVDINAFIKEIVELMEREARASGIKFAADFEENLPSIKSDPSQLQQVFLNLSTNAMDALESMPYGAIKITTCKDNSGKGIRIHFADTGTGIRPEHIEKVFDPFFTTKPVGKGTGLGLSVCYSIIERLGGTIKVRSMPGEGTEFIMSLPLDPPLTLQESLAQN